MRQFAWTAYSRHHAWKRGIDMSTRGAGGLGRPTHALHSAQPE
ncbi:hypothetical protein A176_007048 [Myxococcus hansupus]|uniref:Uncharacterized protein n=1 Tax=Pseudomyxococcus hansupus TaxID=1297742 RepID=A0A0H4X3B2_9BACT|nr:hypothetical protein A176_007048 [Myxococcus hansupus]